MKDNKTTTETTVPSYITDAQKAMLGAAAGIATPFMQPSKNAIAPQNEDQLMAGQLARQSAMGAFNTDFSGRIAGAGKGYDPTMVTGQGITSLMNPYLEQVGASTLANMRREKTATDAQIGARHASGVAFGGSGSALERAQLNRGYGEQVGQTIQSLLSGGYDRAASLASANADRANQAGQFNAGQGLQAQIAAAGASSNAFNNQQQAMQSLLGYGNQSQSYQQSILDVPKNSAAWLSAFIPGATPQTTTTRTPTNPLSSILGVASLF